MGEKNRRVFRKFAEGAASVVIPDLTFVPFPFASVSKRRPDNGGKVPKGATVSSKQGTNLYKSTPPVGSL